MRLILNENDSRPGDEFKLRRWQVYFASGPGWYPVGEYVALDATAAIERAIEIFGEGSGYRAEEIPWDAGPLPRLTASFTGVRGNALARLSDAARKELPKLWEDVETLRKRGEEKE